MKKVYDLKISDKLMQQAADWFLALQQENVSSESCLAWQDWLNQSELNEAAFRRIEGLWSKLDLTSDLPWPTEKEILLDQDKDFIHKSRLQIYAYSGAIAASIVIVLAGYLSLYQDFSPLQKETTYQTAIAEHKTIKLEDGSEINIGARSIINVDYNIHRRNITLVRGEAVFKVAKDKSRPFVVNVAKGSVTAVGTAFNINSTTSNVTVTVLEGIVDVVAETVSEKITPVSLSRVSAGNSISYNNNGQISPVTKANLDAAISWEQGLLVKINTPLEQMIDDVNRYSSKEIIIGDSKLKNIKFTGTIFEGKIDNWLKGLELGYPIKVVDTGQNTILLLAKE